MVDLLFSIGVIFLVVAYFWGAASYFLGLVDAFSDDLIHGVAYLLQGPFWFCVVIGEDAHRYVWPFRLLFIGVAIFAFATIVDHSHLIIGGSP